MFQLEKYRLMAPNIQALDYKIADPPEERTVKVFLGFQLNNQDTEGTLVVVVVVDFSLALDLSEINNCYTRRSHSIISIIDNIR